MLSAIRDNTVAFFPVGVGHVSTTQCNQARPKPASLSLSLLVPPLSCLATSIGSWKK